MINKALSKQSAFTIVELLVVIVVIGILATITIVSYTGISNKAKTASLQSDLSGASKQLQMYQVENGSYPTANNCPTPGSTEICLKSSSDNTFNYTSDGTTFGLTATNANGTAYNVTNNTAVAAGAIVSVPVAATQGPRSPGTVVDDATTGTVAWVNPGNAISSDSSYATVSVFGNTHYLKATNFGFTIPAGATINGITVEVQGMGSTRNNFDYTWEQYIKIVKSNGSYGTTNKVRVGFEKWLITPTVMTYGSSSDLWGETWTPADINNTNFGFGLEVFNSITSSSNTTSVDFIRITVDYTTS